MFNIYATDYAPVDPITPPCEITPIFIGYKGENKARCLVFDLAECVETFGDGGFVISFIRHGDDLPYLVTNTDRLDNNAIWIITDTDTAVDGYGMVQLQYIVDDVVCKSALYRTITFDSNGITGDVPDPYEDLLAQIAAYAAQAEGAATTATAAAQTATTAVENGIVTERSQRIAADEGLNTRINELMGLAGAPSMANSAAAMTDSSKVYVYTGNEAGYLTGHWYYYNGTEWTDGGVYQATAVDTDKTLTVENMAADAAVVGDKIDECMAAFVLDSASGSIASFTDGADGVPVKDLVVNISPVQSGTGDPSPTNVRAISGWTAANINSGINIYNPNLVTWADGLINADGTIDTSEAMVERYHYTANLLPIKGGTMYTISATRNSVDRGTALSFYNASGVFIENNVVFPVAGAITGAVSATFTAPSNAVYYRLRIPKTANAFVNIQIEQGATASEYTEPTVYNVSFGSAGTVYSGTLDVLSGMLTVTYKGINLGGYNWSVYSADSTGHSFVMTAPSDIKPVANNYTRINGLCSSYVLYYFNTASSWAEHDMTLCQVYGPQRIIVRDTRYTVASDFKTAVNGVTFVYELAQPVSYQLTPTEVKTILGINNIWADTGDITSLEYRANTKLYIEHLTAPDGDMIADANITSGSYFMVNNNLYLATANIANGGAITPGTNCTATNLAAALNAINS